MLFQVEDFVKGGIVESGQVVQVIWDSTLYPAKILTSSEDELKINRVVNKLIEAKTNFDPALEQSGTGSHLYVATVAVYSRQRCIIQVHNYATMKIC